jgi:peroxiredoxin 2/4
MGGSKVGPQRPPQSRPVTDIHLELSLSAYTGANHWLVLVFFPRAWSFICPTEIKAFSARLEEFLYSRSCAVVFASTDSEHCLKAWNSTSEMEGGLGGVHLPMIADSTHELSKSFGVLIEEQGVAQRALFIIDPRGVVRAITVNDADVGRSVDETQRVLDALVFKDEFGEGCPVDWKKGDQGINTTIPVEGKVDVNKKSWSEWARPKLQRAFSGASQRSIGSVMSDQPMRLAPTSGERTHGSITPLSSMHAEKQGSIAAAMQGEKQGSISAIQTEKHGSITPLSGTYAQSTQASGQHSPIVSPTNMTGGMGQQMDEMLKHRMDNLEAAFANQGIIGTAN